MLHEASPVKLPPAFCHILNELFVAFLFAAVCHLESAQLKTSAFVVVDVVVVVTQDDTLRLPSLFLLSSNDLRLHSGDPHDVLEIADENPYFFSLSVLGKYISDCHSHVVGSLQWHRWEMLVVLDFAVNRKSK